MLMAFWTVQRLTREINQLQMQAMKTRIKLTNHQKYASKLGGSGYLTAGSIAGLSADLIPRATMFAQYSNQASSMSAMQNLQAMKMSGMVQNIGNPMSQYQLEMSAFSRFKEEALKALKQQEIDVLNDVEKEIQLEMNHIEQQLQMKQAELQSAKQLASQEAKESAPRYGLG